MALNDRCSTAGAGKIMNPAATRSLRIQELTKMALRGAKYEEIEKRALQMASRATAEGYLAEVIRRVQK